ncbi:MAG: phosphotransferase [Desulfobaccales bacterium]
MIRLPADHPLYRLLAPHLGAEPHHGLWVERLRASRPVFRFSRGDNGTGAVGKFFLAQRPATSQDRSLVREYDNYRTVENLGFAAAGLIPRLLGRATDLGLGLLLEGTAGPDLDYFLAQACQGWEREACFAKVANLGELLAFFHTRPVPSELVSLEPAFAYLKKLQGQLQALGLLSPADINFLAAVRRFWEDQDTAFPDRRVLLHGDATPTNFLFPNGRIIALDLERLRPGDRLFDLSWIAGELKHAWAWRQGDWVAGEKLIQTFFQAYLKALSASDYLSRRVFALNPFYMALAEMRIARNSYLSWEYRRALVAEALKCLDPGRRMP